MRRFADSNPPCSPDRGRSTAGPCPECNVARNAESHRYEGARNTTIFLAFLRRLIRDAPRKVFLIVDTLKVHRAQAVTRWVHDHRDRLELFYLPSYAPEHNPEEFLNNDRKQTLARRRTPKTKAALKSGLTSYICAACNGNPPRCAPSFRPPASAMQREMVMVGN
jgi:transposase